MRASSLTVVAVAVIGVACGGSEFSGSGDGGSTDGATDATANDAASDATTGDATAGDGGSDATSRDAATDSAPGDGGAPVNHRPSDSQCSAAAPAGNCSLMGGACAHDTDCTNGTNGRCVESTHGARLCRCTYDGCVHDTDCSTGQVCACHGSAYTNGIGNTCIPGNCRVDADCGVGGYCSPSHGGTGCGEVTGYYCHTPGDQCRNDSDCVGMGGLQVCGWSAAHSRWECVSQPLCP